MRLSRQSVMVASLFAVGACASAPNVRAPLGAFLTRNANTGDPTPLRVDPNAKVILSSASGLPPAAFLPSQAARGERVYGQTCGLCHEPGQLIGQGFVESWNNRRLYDLYALVRGTMPLDNPGAMKEGGIPGRDRVSASGEQACVGRGGFIEERYLGNAVDPDRGGSSVGGVGGRPVAMRPN